MDKQKNFKKELPENYKQVFYMNAGDKKTGLIFNVCALLTMLVICAVILLTANYENISVFKENIWHFLGFYVLLLAGIVVYTILHELTHGIAYKSLTGEKLTYGLKWSCAFCGVPTIYVNRKTALIALAAPFTVFCIIFLPLTIFFGITGSLAYILFGVWLAVHVGGCAGDLYMMYILLFKYKDNRLLMKDTGPEQFLYLPE